MPLILDGTTGIIANNIADYAISTAKLANSAITVPKIGYAGAVLQVVAVEDATLYTTTSTSTWSTIISASITPSSTSSKILIFARTGEPDVATGWAQVRVFRNATATEVFKLTTEFGRGIDNISESHYAPIFATAMDSPATLSNTTYLLSALLSTAGTFRAGNGSKHQITLMEIAG